jgi:hypothetical protein
VTGGAAWGEPDHHLTPYPGKGEEVNDRAPQLPHPGLLPDGRYRGPAARADALLHHPQRARGAHSVFWSLLFILALYLTAPAYAAFAKYEIYSTSDRLVDRATAVWVSSWGKIGWSRSRTSTATASCNSLELALNPDVILLATPEIAGLPYVISGLVAAGALAAALSTADGLLLTIASALSHDVYYKVFRPHATRSGGWWFRSRCCWWSPCWRPASPRRSRRRFCSWSPGPSRWPARLSSGPDSWRLLEAGNAGGCRERHGDRSSGDPLLHGARAFRCHPLARHSGNRHGALAGDSVDLGRGVGRCRRLPDDRRGQPVGKPPSKETQDFVESVRYPEFDRW